MTYYSTPNDGPLDPATDLDLTSEHLNTLEGVELKPTLKARSRARSAGFASRSSRTLTTPAN